MTGSGAVEPWSITVGHQLHTWNHYPPRNVPCNWFSIRSGTLVAEMVLKVSTAKFKDTICIIFLSKSDWTAKIKITVYCYDRPHWCKIVQCTFRKINSYWRTKKRITIFVKIKTFLLLFLRNLALVIEEKSPVTSTENYHIIYIWQFKSEIGMWI